MRDNHQHDFSIPAKSLTAGINQLTLYGKNAQGEGISLTQYPGNGIGTYKSTLAWQIVLGLGNESE